MGKPLAKLLAPQRAEPAAPHTRGGFVSTARQKQAYRLLSNGQRHTMLVGGSRSGKTFTLVRALIIRAMKGPNSRHVIFRHRFNAVKSTIWLDTFPKVMRLCYPHVKYKNNKQEGYTKFENGSEIWFAGLDDAERIEKILGFEFCTIYFNECSQIPYSSVLMALTRLAQLIPELQNKAFYDLNPTGTAHWTYLLFVEKKNPDPKNPVPLRDPDNYAHLFMNPLDNVDNVASDYIETLEAMPEKMRKRFLDGEYVPEIEGALWTIGSLERQRWDDAKAFPAFSRIVIAIDPSGCAGKEDKRSDEVGVVVAARIGNGDKAVGVVLEDLSGSHRPEDWGRIAVEAYKRWDADCIIGEINYGGDMVRAIVHGANRNVPFKMVTATRGKIVRAEPISALYDLGLVYHAQRFTKLEDQLCNFSTAGYQGERSPDRADAAIWALTELLLGETSTGLLEYYRAAAATQKAEKDAKSKKSAVYTKARNVGFYTGGDRCRRAKSILPGRVLRPGGGCFPPGYDREQVRSCGVLH